VPCAGAPRARAASPAADVGREPSANTRFAVTTDLLLANAIVDRAGDRSRSTLASKIDGDDRFFVDQLAELDGDATTQADAIVSRKRHAAA
jgi:hypothetical protein